jgi:hypothetical protein
VGIPEAGGSVSRPVSPDKEPSDNEPELEDKGLSVSRPVFSGIEPSDKEPEIDRATPSADSTALVFISGGSDSDRGLWGGIWGIP